MLVIVLIGVAAAYGIAQVVPKKDDDEPPTPTPTATVVACTPAPSTFGEPPDTFTYDKVDEKTRANTVKALELDEADGPVEMVKARAAGSRSASSSPCPDKTDPRTTPPAWSPPRRAAAPRSRAARAS